MNLDVRWQGTEAVTVRPVTIMRFNNEGFPIRDCGCRVRGDKICKHFYANQRSSQSSEASGTSDGDGGTVSIASGDLVHPGDPQPAPTFFHFPSVAGKPARLVFPDVRGENWDHTRFLRREYYWYLRQWRRRSRANP